MKGNFDDNSGSPGSNMLVAGDMSAGYFGLVPVSELFTGTELAALCGIIEGVAQFDNEPWLKFAIDGKIIFKSKKTYRHSISWNAINDVGCVNGNKIVTKNRLNYNVRLMNGIVGSTSDYVNNTFTNVINSEWNKLIYPICIQAKTQNWYYPQYVLVNNDYWGIDFSNIDLQFHFANATGQHHWTQGISTDGRLIYRGGNDASGIGRQ